MYCRVKLDRRFIRVLEMMGGRSMCLGGWRMCTGVEREVRIK